MKQIGHFKWTSTLLCKNECTWECLYFSCVSQKQSWELEWQLSNCLFVLRPLPNSSTKVYVIYFPLRLNFLLLLFLLLVVASCDSTSPNLQISLPQPTQSLIATPTAREEDLSAAPPTIFDTDNGTVSPLVQDHDFHSDEKRISSVLARTLEFKWDWVKSDGMELAKWCPRWARWCLAGAPVDFYSTEQPRRTETPASKILKTSSKMAETLPRRLPPSWKREQN